MKIQIQIAIHAVVINMFNKNTSRKKNNRNIESGKICKEKIQGEKG